jgi:uncharacterized protein YyaL (SSP411 family)
MVTEIVGYLARRMTAEEGGFYTAEDAEIEAKEGETYLWTRAEITNILGSTDAARFFGLYELTPVGLGVLRIRRDQIISDEGEAVLHDSGRAHRAARQAARSPRSEAPATPR